MVDRGYPMVVHALSEEDGGGFVAFAPDLRGCMADGETPEAALTDLRNAIEEWIDEAKRLDRPIPFPGAVAAKAEHERAEIKSLIEKQDHLIKTQERLIAASRAELAAVRKSIGLDNDHRTSVDRSYFVWVDNGDITRQVIAQNKPRKRSSALTN